MRIIDADYMQEKAYQMNFHGKISEQSLFLFNFALSEMPTVDAVPVVRCSKCKYGITGHGISDGWALCAKPYATDTVGGAMHRCDWFCADGKEKDEQENQEEKV